MKLRGSNWQSQARWLLAVAVVGDVSCRPPPRTSHQHAQAASDGGVSLSQGEFPLPELYTLDAPAPVAQVGFLAESPGDGVVSLYTRRATEAQSRRITFAPGGVSDPVVLGDGRILFRMRHVETPGAAEWFTLRTDGTELAAASASELLAASRGSASGDARGRAPGSSSVVREHLTTGQLYCLDSRISDAPTTGIIRQIRVFAASPKQDCATEAKVVADVPVDADGSFYIQLPARQPFRLATLDEAGRVLRAMSTWLWVMPGEQRGCIGCHEDRNRTPPNKHVLALRKPPQRVGLDATQPGEVRDVPGD